MNVLEEWAKDIMSSQREQKADRDTHRKRTSQKQRTEQQLHLKVHAIPFSTPFGESASGSTAGVRIHALPRDMTLYKRPTMRIRRQVLPDEGHGGATLLKHLY